MHGAPRFQKKLPALGVALALALVSALAPACSPRHAAAIEEIKNALQTL